MEVLHCNDGAILRLTRPDAIRRLIEARLKAKRAEGFED
jgi:hypothetical protein